MNERLSVTTNIRCRYRMLTLPTEPQAFSGMAANSCVPLRESLKALEKTSEALVTFLLEIDRKLDVVIRHLELTSIEEDFPYEGRITQLSTSRATLECQEVLAPGDFCEFLFFLGEYPLHIVSVIGEVISLAGGAVSHASFSSFAVRLTKLRVDEEEVLIKFIFQEERRRIRQAKKAD